MSADPLAVHVPGEADLNLYAYVSGKLLQATDPTGLCDENGTSGPCGGANNGEGGEGPSKQNEVEVSPSYGEKPASTAVEDMLAGAAKATLSAAVDTALMGPIGDAVKNLAPKHVKEWIDPPLNNGDEVIGAAIATLALPVAGRSMLSRIALGGEMRLRSSVAQTAEHVATSASPPSKVPAALAAASPKGLGSSVAGGRGPGSGLTGQTRAQLQESQATYEKLIAEHQQKLADCKANPWAHDNKGLLEKAPSDEIRMKIIDGRIHVIEGQITKQQGELAKNKKS